MPACPAVRSAEAVDLPEVLAIYAQEVLHGTASFEIEPPDLAELARRYERVRKLGLPWLVAEYHEGIAGFAYATTYRDRPAYRYTVEDSVYVAPGARGAGLGRTLLEGVISRASMAGARQMVAGIGDSGRELYTCLTHFAEDGQRRNPVPLGRPTKDVSKLLQKTYEVCS